MDDPGSPVGDPAEPYGIAAIAASAGGITEHHLHGDLLAAEEQRR
jgi:hypothetical protein